MRFEILKDLFKSEKGATAMEYGLIAAGIALAVVAAIFLMGDSLAFLFSSAGSALSAAG